MVEIGTRNIKGCRVSIRYQRFYDKINRLYFGNKLPRAIVQTAPLLRITSLPQKEAESEDWEDAGEYALAGKDDDGCWNIILDRGTCVFHPMITKQSVIHEAIHIYLDPYKGHGVQYKKQVRRVAALGALDDLI